MVKLMSSTSQVLGLISSGIKILECIKKISSPLHMVKSRFSYSNSV
jgi:hypothetical protein